jgi:hypothetical protein
MLAKQLKSCERHMQELTDSIMDTEERKEVKAKEINNIFNKKMTKIFSNLEKVLPSSTGSLQDTKQT